MDSATVTLCSRLDPLKKRCRLRWQSQKQTPLGYLGVGESGVGGGEGERERERETERETDRETKRQIFFISGGFMKHGVVLYVCVYVCVCVCVCVCARRWSVFVQVVYKSTLILTVLEYNIEYNTCSPAPRTAAGQA